MKQITAESVLNQFKNLGKNESAIKDKFIAYKDIDYDLDNGSLDSMLNCDYPFDAVKKIMPDPAGFQKLFDKFLADNKLKYFDDTYGISRKFFKDPKIMALVNKGFKEYEDGLKHKATEIEKEMFHIYPVLDKINHQIKGHGESAATTIKIAKSKSGDYAVTTRNMVHNNIKLSDEDVIEFNKYLKELKKR